MKLWRGLTVPAAGCYPGLKKHPEVLKTSRDNGFLMWCLRIVLLPFGLLYDVFVAPVLFVLQLLCLIQFLNLLGRGQ